MKAKRRVLTEMIKKTGWSSQALREIKVKFWLSKEYTIYPKEHHGLEVIKTETLTDVGFYTKNNNLPNVVLVSVKSLIN